MLPTNGTRHKTPIFIGGNVFFYHESILSLALT